MDINEKEIFKALNDVEIDLSNIEKQQFQMDEIQQQKIKRNILRNTSKVSHKRNKKIKYASTAAVLSAILLTGSMFMINPAIADEIPIVNSIIATHNNINPNAKDYINMVGKSVSNNGITITLKEIVSDDNTIKMGYIIKSNRPIKELYNNDMIYVGTKSWKINNNELGGCGEIQISPVNENTLILYESCDYEKTKLPEKYKLNVAYENIGKVNGNWSFNIDVNNKDIKKVSKTFDINKRIHLQTGDINIKKITASPISFKMNFYRINKDDNNFPQWNAITDKGEQLVDAGTFLSSEGDNFGSHTFTPAKELPSKVSFVNLLTDNSKQSFTETKEMSNLPVAFKYENLGTLTINKVAKLEDKILVYVHAESILPLTLAQQLRLIDKNNTDTDSNSLWTNVNKIKYDKTYKDLILEYSSGFRTTKYSKDADYEFSFNNGDSLRIDPNFKLELNLENGH